MRIALVVFVLSLLGGCVTNPVYTPYRLTNGAADPDHRVRFEINRDTCGPTRCF